MTGFTSVLFMMCGLATLVDATGFLQAIPDFGQEHMSEEGVQTSFLAEVEDTFGEGIASGRIKQFAAAFSTIYPALPKNENGYLGHAAVHYAVHRIFLRRNGWVIKGLDSAHGHTSTFGAGPLKEEVPIHIQDVFEKRLGGRGFGIHELSVFAATIDHLIHKEAMARVGSALKVYNLSPTSVMSQSMADDVLDTYMAAYIHEVDLSASSVEDAMELKNAMPAVYQAWTDTKYFMRTVFNDVTQADGTAEQKASGELDFALVGRVAERVSEQFGKVQQEECTQMKGDLMHMEEKGTGRVRLSEFYKPALDGQWQFQESVSYLREIGSLDETDPDRPRVVIANYVNSRPNCVAASNFYSVCCIDECASLLGHLEKQIAAPDASPARIASIVSKLESSTVAAPRKLPSALLDRLGEIAAGHGGTVPLHGRLFAQWMHHAYPRECPYPHISGTTHTDKAMDFVSRTGESASASDEEMRVYVDDADALKQRSTEEEEDTAALPWAPEEELLVMRRPHVQASTGSSLLLYMRNAVFSLAIIACVYGVLDVSAYLGDPAGTGCKGPETVFLWK